MGNRKYTVEELQEEALKYNSRNEFKKGSRSMYSAAHSYGVIKEITSHMIKKHPRVCITCGESKVLEEFVKNAKSTEGRHTKCKSCHNKRQNERAAANPNMKNTRNASSYKAKQRTKNNILNYYSGVMKCADCGLISDIFDIYDFHHVNPKDKQYTVSSIMDYKWETVKAELDKCVLLCANCHRIRHYKEKENKWMI